MKLPLFSLALFSINLILPTVLFGQNKKWDIAISYGMAVPIDGFSKVAPEKPNTTLSFGFDKDGNSAAENGQFISMDFSYHFNRHWLATLDTYYSTNSVNTEPVLDYVNDFFDTDFTSLSNKDYRVTSIAIGLGYQFHYKKLSFTITPLIGYATISSPDFVFQHPTANYNFKAIDLTPSILLGVNNCINYEINSKFYIGFKADFNSANFSYNIPQKIAGADPSTKEDMVSYRILKLGLTFCFRF